MSYGQGYGYPGNGGGYGYGYHQPQFPVPPNAFGQNPGYDYNQPNQDYNQPQQYPAGFPQPGVGARAWEPTEQAYGGYPQAYGQPNYPSPEGAPDYSQGYQSYASPYPVAAPPEEYVVDLERSLPPPEQGSLKRKALLIGINYTGTSAQLNGCHNDVYHLKEFLIGRYNFNEEDMVTLMDTEDAVDMSIPTRANIIRAMEWLVRDAQPGDSFFFHFSGHGGSVEDLDGDESDGYDETIYPVDHEASGQIIDDEMHDIMVRPLPPGCRLTAIYDSCHSGTALDLPYVYSTEGKLKGPNHLADIGEGAMNMFTSYATTRNMDGVFRSLVTVGKKILSNEADAKKRRKDKMSPAHCIQWSGCKDSQTSADTNEAGKATGAMSWAFIQSLNKYPNPSYQELLCAVRDLLRDKYSQKPQLSCSHELDCDSLFII